MLTVSALHMALGIGTAKLLDPGRRAEGGPAMTTPTPKSA
jgi:hypothetical protein